MRLGLFGGTFDPVHYGHLLLAESCREECRLDEVWLIPAATPPHKQPKSLTPANQRVEMLELAVGGHSAISVSRVEVDREGVSYTVDTLRDIQAAEPRRHLFLLMGADTLDDLPNWREPAQIVSLVDLVAVPRVGAPKPDFTRLASTLPPAEAKSVRQHVVWMPHVELTSTDIRERVAAGRSIRYRTPRAVEKYIETAGLYRT